MTQAIINQPQAAILTMDAVVKRAVVVDDMIAIRPIMNLGMSFDHRLNDGLQAARFLQDVRVSSRVGRERYPALMRAHGWRWYAGLVMVVILIILVIYLVGSAAEPAWSSGALMHPLGGAAR